MMRNGFFEFGSYCSRMGWGGGIFMMIGGLLLLGLLIYAVVRLTGHNQKSQPVINNPVQQDIGNALNILNERYARGELNEEEYARKKTELRK